MRQTTAFALVSLALALSLAPSTASAQSWLWSDRHAHCGAHEVSLGRPLNVDPYMGPHGFDVVVGGDVRCREVTGGRCHGYVYHHPAELIVRSTAWVEIEVVRADVNTVMALVGPSGSFSDNDGGRGHLSRIRALLVPGVYHLYLGVRHRHDIGSMTVVVDAEPAHHRVAAPHAPHATPVHVPAPPPHHARRDDWDDDDWDDDDDDDDDHRGRRGRRRGHDD